jgi:hypothetical protein
LIVQRNKRFCVVAVYASAADVVVVPHQQKYVSHTFLLLYGELFTAHTT